MGKIRDLTGMKFGRLVALDYYFSSEEVKGRFIKWNCICSCGNKVAVRSSDLIREKTKSCGCLGIEIRRGKSLKHGLYNSSEHSIWGGILTGFSKK